MAGTAIAGNANVFITLYQEVRSTDVASITLTRRRYVIDWLWSRPHARTEGMATRTYFGRVLKNSLNVALFAL